MPKLQPRTESRQTQSSIGSSTIGVTMDGPLALLDGSKRSERLTMSTLLSEPHAKMEPVAPHHSR